MRKEYQYFYKWDREYCYPDSNVLINKLNIRDAGALAAAEREITSLKIAMAKQSPVKGRFDLQHLRRIHQYVFAEIYPWAGELRHVDIAKGNQFCLAQNLTMYADTLFQKLERENYLLGAENIPQRLAYYLSEINVLHPFREGNGRTQRLFIEYLAGAAGYKVDFSDVSPEEMVLASAESFACEYERINAMFARITTPTTKEEQKRKRAYFLGRKQKGPQPK